MAALTPPSSHRSISGSSPDVAASGEALSPGALLREGQRLRVTQQVPRQNGNVTSTVEGTLIRFEQQKTGSWFAHSKDGKLWLDRLELRKDDGELISMNVDQFTRVEVVGDAMAGRE